MELDGGWRRGDAEGDEAVLPSSCSERLSSVAMTCSPVFTGGGACGYQPHHAHDGVERGDDNRDDNRVGVALRAAGGPALPVASRLRDARVVAVAVGEVPTEAGVAVERGELAPVMGERQVARALHGASSVSGCCSGCDAPLGARLHSVWVFTAFKPLTVSKNAAACEEEQPSEGMQHRWGRDFESELKESSQVQSVGSNLNQTCGKPTRT
ncbi:hypothetical protein EYF80_010336 [Liparis tanakae]|uniref:Uncharacterized protein n=1 Tax=Liparis tanakae TaxID=230148 RepID=A0A4Z2INC5_9TELE|nr:hypothetical protein EYF80_010336 [Liparis tanakae]